MNTHPTLRAAFIYLLFSCFAPALTAQAEVPPRYFLPEFNFTGGHAETIVSMAYNANDEWLATLDQTTKVIVWDRQTTLPIAGWRIDTTAYASRRIEVFRFDVFGRVVCKDTEHLALWDLRSKKRHFFTGKRCWTVDSTMVLCDNLLIDFSTDTVTVDTLRFAFYDPTTAYDDLSASLLPNSRLILFEQDSSIVVADLAQNKVVYQKRRIKLYNQVCGNRDAPFPKKTIYTTDGRYLVSGTVSFDNSTANYRTVRTTDWQTVREFICAPLAIVQQYMDSLFQVGLITRNIVVETDEKFRLPPPRFYGHIDIDSIDAYIERAYRLSKQPEKGVFDLPLDELPTDLERVKAIGDTTYAIYQLPDGYHLIHERYNNPRLALGRPGSTALKWFDVPRRYRNWQYGYWLFNRHDVVVSYPYLFLRESDEVAVIDVRTGTTSVIGKRSTLNSTNWLPPFGGRLPVQIDGHLASLNLYEDGDGKIVRHGFGLRERFFPVDANEDASSFYVIEDTPSGYYLVNPFLPHRRWLIPFPVQNDDFFLSSRSHLIALRQSTATVYRLPGFDSVATFRLSDFDNSVYDGMDRASSKRYVTFSFNESGSHFYLATDHDVHLFDLERGEMLPAIQLPTQFGPARVAYVNPEGTLVIIRTEEVHDLYEYLPDFIDRPPPPPPLRCFHLRNSTWSATALPEWNFLAMKEGEQILNYGSSYHSPWLYVYDLTTGVLDSMANGSATNHEHLEPTPFRGKIVSSGNDGTLLYYLIEAKDSVVWLVRAAYMGVHSPRPMDSLRLSAGPDQSFMVDRTYFSDWRSFLVEEQNIFVFATGRQKNNKAVWQIIDIEAFSIIGETTHRFTATEQRAFSHSQGFLFSQAVNEPFLTVTDLTTDEEVLRHFSFTDGSYVLLHHQSRKFEAFPQEASKQLSLRIGTTPVTLGRLEPRFRELNLWRKTLERRLVITPPEKKVSLFPRATLRFEEDQRRLAVRLHNQGGGFGDLMIKVGNRELTLIDLDSVSRTQPIVDYRIDLTPYKNLFQTTGVDTIWVTTTNVDNPQTYSPSYDIPYFTGREAAKGTSSLPNKQPGITVATNSAAYGIFVGVNNYPMQRSLLWPERDAEIIHNVLRTSAKAFWPDPSRVDFTLIGARRADGTISTPDRPTIKAAFEQYKKAKPEDVFIFYFSGHGVTREHPETGEPEYYLLPENVTLDGSTPSNPNADWYDFVISKTELTEWLLAIPARKKIIILDACGSGSATETASELAKFMDEDHKQAFNRMSSRYGIYILASSAQNKLSFESDDLRHGYLTYSLLEGIANGAGLLVNGNNRFLNLELWFNYAVDQVPEIAAGRGKIQKPYWSRSEKARHFNIGIIPDSLQLKLRTAKPTLRGTWVSQREEYDDIYDISRRIDGVLRQRSIQKKQFYFKKFADGNTYFVAGVYEVKGDKFSLRYRVIDGRTNNRIITSGCAASGCIIEGDLSRIDLLIQELASRVEAIVVEHHQKKLSRP